MRISLTPRTTEFFTLFARAGGNALETARLVERRFREYPSSGVTQEQVKAAESEGDTITRELINLLNTQYITPFDRDDIFQLLLRQRWISMFVDNLDVVAALSNPGINKSLDVVAGCEGWNIRATTHLRGMAVRYSDARSRCAKIGAVRKFSIGLLIP